MTAIIDPLVFVNLEEKQQEELVANTLLSTAYNNFVVNRNILRLNKMVENKFEGTVGELNRIQSRDIIDLELENPLFSEKYFENFIDKLINSRDWEVNRFSKYQTTTVNIKKMRVIGLVRRLREFFKLDNFDEIKKSLNEKLVENFSIPFQVYLQKFKEKHSDFFHQDYEDYEDFKKKHSKYFKEYYDSPQRKNSPKRKSSKKRRQPDIEDDEDDEDDDEEEEEEEEEDSNKKRKLFFGGKKKTSKKKVSKKKKRSKKI